MTRASHCRRHWALAQSLCAAAFLVATAAAETPLDDPARAEQEANRPSPNAASHLERKFLVSEFRQKSPFQVTSQATTSECIDAHVRGQEARLAGRLIAAKRDLESCASEFCPLLVREDCRHLLELVSSETPVLALVSPPSLEPAELRVLIDGVQLEVAQHGAPFPLDPGAHTVLVEAVGYAPMRTTVTLVAGSPPTSLQIELTELAPRRDARHASTRAPPTRDPPTGDPQIDEPPAVVEHEVPAATYVLGGAAVLAAGFAIHFARSGVDERKRLRRTCAPLCSKRDVDAVERDLLLADVSAGVSLVSAAAAALLYFAESAQRNGNGGDVSIGLGSERVALQLGGRF